MLIEINGVNYTMVKISGTTWEYSNWLPSILGLKLYTIYANDTINNWNSLYGNITVMDTTGPTLFNIIKSAESIFLGQSISVQVNVIDQSEINNILIELENSNHTMTQLYGNIWEIINLTPSTIGSLIFTIYANDSLCNWKMVSDTITVNIQGGDGNIGSPEVDFELVVVFSTVVIIRILVLGIVIMLRPKRFIK